MGWDQLGYAYISTFYKKSKSYLDIKTIYSEEHSNADRQRNASTHKLLKLFLQ